MKITITLTCPQCRSSKIVKNGNKIYKKQNYLCKDCHRQFIGDHNLTYKCCHSSLCHRLKKMLVRGVGIRDAAYIEKISVNKVLSALSKTDYRIVPKNSHYKNLEVDEFWSYVGNKENKLWLLYVYSSETGEIICYVFGRRNLKTARKLKQKLSELCISYETTCSGNWRGFVVVLGGVSRRVGKEYTVGIKGNNCRLRHRIRRACR